jgi:hypothetical protein
MYQFSVIQQYCNQTGYKKILVVMTVHRQSKITRLNTTKTQRIASLALQMYRYRRHFAVPSLSVLLTATVLEALAVQNVSLINSFEIHL